MSHNNRDRDLHTSSGGNMSSGSGMYNTSYVPSTTSPNNRDRDRTGQNTQFADQVHMHGQDGYRQELHGLSGQSPERERDYRLLPTKDSYEHGNFAHHHIRGQTMKDRVQLRKMTDVACGCAFLIFWLVMCMVTTNGLSYGDPRRLYHGFDYSGQLCGVSPNVTNKPLLYWPDSNDLSMPICVGECPGLKPTSISVPRETVVNTQGTDYVRTEIMRQDATLMTYNTKQIGGRFCLPAGNGPSLANITRLPIIGVEGGSVLALLLNSYKDVCCAWSIIMFMLPLSMAVGYGYIFLLRYCARMVLNMVLAALIFGSGFLSFYCVFYVRRAQSRAEDMLGRYTDNCEEVVLIIGLCSACVCFLLLCAGYSMINKMEKISAVVETAGDAMWSVQLLLCMPAIEVVCKLVYTMIWMFFASYVMSNGNIEGTHVDVGGQRLTGLVRTFHYSLAQKLMIGFYCVGYVWGLEFISVLFKFCISYALAIWYFQPCRADMSKTEITPEVWKTGFTNALFFHMGSLCIGAAVHVLLYAFVPVHGLLEYLLIQSQTSYNPVVKAMVYSCTCSIKCMQEVISYVNKGAIVEMVLRGDHDFFTSAGSAMRVMRDADQSVIALHGVTLIFQSVGILVSGTIGGLSTYWFTSTVSIFVDPASKYFLEDRLGITVIGGIISMAVATVFMWTLDLVADSLLFCWLVEGEDDRTHQTFAPKSLRNVVRFDDFNMVKDNRMISGIGNMPYEMRDSHSQSRDHSFGSPNHSYNQSRMDDQYGGGHGMSGSPGKTNAGGWSQSSHLTSQTGQGQGHR